MNDEMEWEHLPYDPQSFFKLDEGFTRKDLKRAYTRLIKKYKPEKFPTEFGMIRAAYEELEQRLSYGVTISTQPVARPTRSEASPSFDQADSKPASLSTLERLKSGDSAETIYSEFKSRQIKSPTEYLHLALLSETLGLDSETMFDWLCKGLEAYPNEHAISRFLFEYLNSEKISNDLQEILQRCSNVVHEAYFFYFTEPVWHELLRKEGCEKFRDTFEKFTADDDDVLASNQGQTVFVSRLLRRFAFQLDLGWMRQKIVYLEESIEEDDTSAYQEIDLFRRVVHYREVRSEFLNNNPLRARIDGIITKYVQEGIAGSLKEFLELQVYISNETEAVEKAFPENEDPLGICYWLYINISDRIHFEIQGEDETIDYDGLGESIFETMHRIEKSTKSSKANNSGCLWFFVLFFNLFLFGYLSIKGFDFLSDFLPQDRQSGWGRRLYLLGFAALLVYPYFKIVWPITKNVDFGLTEKWNKQAYQTIWKPELMRLLIKYNLTQHQLSDLIEKKLDNKDVEYSLKEALEYSKNSPSFGFQLIARKYA